MLAAGLALGVDGAAHEGALQAQAQSGGPGTVAVLGTGLDAVYPRSHIGLAARIAAGGLLVSEMALGTPPLPQNFPLRNRIIAALARGTLVVEAGLPSGSLITARFVNEQGREVFAVPGSPLDPRASLRFMKSKLTDQPPYYRPVLVEVAPGHWVAEHDPAEGLPGLSAA